MNRSTLLGATVLLALLAAPAAGAAVCRVAPQGSGDGTSWSSPMPLQTALAANACGEIWVRKGLYKPVVPAHPVNITHAERKVSFVIRPGLRVYGGFDGTESLRHQRNPAANRSVFSGDLDANDVADGEGIVADGNGVRELNSYNVVTMDGGTAAGPVTRGTVLDGVIITSGRATGTPVEHLDSGAGLRCRAENTGQECSPTLRDIWFSGNAGGYGAGMYLFGVSGGIGRPLLERVRFSGNRVSGNGGALYNDGSSAGHANPQLVDVEFTGNNAGTYGGAMFNNGRQGQSSPVLDRVGFSGNSANYGGAIYNDAINSGTTRALISNTTFSTNNASTNGGAIYHYVGSNGNGRMMLSHVTFKGNSAARGGAIFNYGGAGNLANAGPTFDGVILWGNQASTEGPEIHNQNATPVVRDSIVAGGCPATTQCAGVISANPALGALADNGGFSRTMLPNTGSPAINAANTAACPPTDQREIPRAQGSRCDIGAVEVEVSACHVKGDATGANNGSNWANAYIRLQDALANAGCGEIRVARGVYTPTDGSNTAISFSIRPGQRVYGGFAGTETHLDQRDPAVHRTVLSADIGNDDVTDANGIVVNGADRRGSNSIRVVTLDGTTAAGPVTPITLLEGFAITAASSTLTGNGGGVYCDGHGAGHECSPTLRNLLFSANMSDAGGGMYNFADDGGRANPTLENVTFRNNSAANFGCGCMYNRAWNGGDSSPALTNVTFVGNWGIAMVNDGAHAGHSSPLLNHVTFHANSDRFTAASMFNSGRFGGSSEPTLTNVILWGGTFTLPGEAGCEGGTSHPEICNASATPTLRAALIAGGCPAGAICGTDVHDLDPLLGPLGDNGGATPTLLPDIDSPAINAGADDVCTATDQRGLERPQGSRCDIGAVEAIDDRIFADDFE
ncbi:MAG: hypothetical protein IPH43_12335 [Xanthomonadales bacterium]|nr:hypothetical protein [Xanthomonadales bacterium]